MHERFLTPLFSLWTCAVWLGLGFKEDVESYAAQIVEDAIPRQSA